MGTENTSRASWKILIVDDDEDNVNVASRYLKFKGVATRTADNGETGLKVLEDYEPTVVLLDLSMPTMDGWEMLKRLKANPKTATIPVIAVTAHAMQEDQRRVMEAGFDGYITKPFMLATFVEDIERCLARIRESRG